MVTGGAPITPLFSHTGVALPRCPGTAMSASCGNVSMSAIHTAFISEDGSIRAYIAARFSTMIVLAPCPDSAVAVTAAGQLMNPSGSPTPVPVMNR